MSEPPARRAASWELLPPGAAELAELAGLAARVQPELLRALRLHVLPHLAAGDEADLWWSPAVTGRGPRSMSLANAAVRAFRERLRARWVAGDRARLEAASEVVSRMHRDEPPALRLEERVCWAVVRGGESAADDVDAELGRALVAIAAEGRTGLADWWHGAYGRLPEVARRTPTAVQLNVVTADHLGPDAVRFGGAPASALDDRLAGALRSVPDVPVGVLRSGPLLQLGDVDRARGVALPVPAGRTAVVEVEWSPSPGASLRVASVPREREVAVVPRDAVVSLTVGTGPVRIHTARGLYFDIPADTSRDVQAQRTRTVPRLGAEYDGAGTAFGLFSSVADAVELCLRDPAERFQVQHGGGVVAFSPDGRLLATAGGDGTAAVWRVEDGSEQARMGASAGFSMTSLAFGPDGRSLVTGGLDGAAVVWRADDGTRLSRVDHGDVVRAVAFSPGGRLVASAGDDGTARVWQADSGVEQARADHGDAVRAVAFSPDGRLVASAGTDGTARVWRADDGVEQTRVEHDGPVRVVVFSPDGQLVASGTGTGTASVWRADTGVEQARVDHGAPVVGVVFSPDGQLVASAGSTVARVWRAGDGVELAQVDHDSWVHAVAFSPDGRLVASADDRGARVWQAATGVEQARRDHDHTVEAVVFGPDGRLVASASIERVTRVWSVDDPETRVALARREGDLWHGYLPGVGPGQRYGYRVHGPYDPEKGHRCDPSVLLLDPYARLVEDGRSVVVTPYFDWGDDRPPRTPWADTVIYEAHVKGLTMRHPDVPEEIRGTYAAVAHPAMIEHYRRVGITAVELMPVHHFVQQEHLVERGLWNYWGYDTIGYFAPHHEYAVADPVREFQAMVRDLHEAGIEVILDVAFSHTGEGGADGPTLSFRGIDNAAYYRLVEDDPRYYVDYTGTGNSLQVRHPRVLQMIMDSLRFWVQEMHVDGFRFDSAATLAREFYAVDRLSTFFDLVQQDPVVSQIKLIAEPWDVGEGGYQVGNFPAVWTEWNDRFERSVRDFWRGREDGISEFATRLTGSSDLYEVNGRRPYASINYVTTHDGFTLHDLTSYDDKHNEANGEDNRDGSDDNRSWNCGVEGETDDSDVLALRGRQQRNLLATLLLSQGVPMLRAGDELSHTQDGNNNAYCQDNEISWLDWDAEPGLVEFVATATRLRREHPVFRRTRYGQTEWFRPDGQPMSEDDWEDGGLRAVALRLDGGAIEEPGPHGERIRDDTFLLLVNADGVVRTFKLPSGTWRVELDTRGPVRNSVRADVEMAPRSLVLLREL